MRTGPVLGIDSCGPETTLALASFKPAGLTMHRSTRLAARTAAAQITRALEELLGSPPFQRLHAVVVVRGPGSFTGIRVGLSAAKALAEATETPIVAVSRLAVLAGLAGTWSAALDAGRGGFYLRDGQTGEERLMTRDEAREGVVDPASLAVCEEKTAAFFPGAHRTPAPEAGDAIRYAEARVLAGDWEDAAELDGLYLWRAEQMLKALGS